MGGVSRAYALWMDIRLNRWDCFASGQLRMVLYGFWLDENNGFKIGDLVF
jgi:hypothetical protein